MEYTRIDYRKTFDFCQKVFEFYGFSKEEAKDITDILLDADLSGIESHGVQRLIRYYHELTDLAYVDTKARPEIVKETPLSATIEGHRAMGQLVGKFAMQLAIDKAKKNGVGMVAVRNSNHYGIAGYYAKMAAEEDLCGVSMCNTESIMVPTFGAEGVLGTNPIAFCMPAEPKNFLFDAATTVVPRGKLEVYVKRGNGLPFGWAMDETGKDSDEGDRVLKNIIEKAGGGILPLGGCGELTSGYKGYGFGMIVEIMCGILSQGATSNHIAREPGHVNTSQFFMAFDHGMFGDKKEIEKRLSVFLQEVRDSKKAEGADRIYIHGEKEYEAREKVLSEGIRVNEKTLSEMKMIGEQTGVEFPF